MHSRWTASTGALTGGLLLILVGGVFLLGELGVVVIAWATVWPLILVAIGLTIVVGGLTGFVRDGGEQTVTVPAEGAGRLALSLRLGAGRYRLSGGGADLVAATADGAGIREEVERRGETAFVRLATAVEPWIVASRGGHTWSIHVAPDVPTTLDVRAGAGEFDLDLSAISLVSATVASGAADTTIVLPTPKGEVPVRIEGGAASFTVRVPAGVEAMVSVTGLVSVSGPTQTPGYAAARDRVTVSVSGGMASVKVVGI